MALTWDDLSRFTWEEFDQLELTWDDIETMSTPDLIALASKKLQRFQNLSPDAPMPIDLVQKVDALTNEIQELKDLISTQKPSSLPRRLAENVFAGILANAALWACSHPQELRNVLFQVIAIIDKVIHQ